MKLVHFIVFVSLLFLSTVLAQRELHGVQARPSNFPRRHHEVRGVRGGPRRPVDPAIRNIFSQREWFDANGRDDDCSRDVDIGDFPPFDPFEDLDDEEEEFEDFRRQEEREFRREERRFHPKEREFHRRERDFHRRQMARLSPFSKNNICEGEPNGMVKCVCMRTPGRPHETQYRNKCGTCVMNFVPDDGAIHDHEEEEEKEKEHLYPQKPDQIRSEEEEEGKELLDEEEIESDEESEEKAKEINLNDESTGSGFKSNEESEEEEIESEEEVESNEESKE